MSLISFNGQYNKPVVIAEGVDHANCPDDSATIKHAIPVPKSRTVKRMYVHSMRLFSRSTMSIRESTSSTEAIEYSFLRDTDLANASGSAAALFSGRLQPAG